MTLSFYNNWHIYTNVVSVMRSVVIQSRVLLTFQLLACRHLCRLTDNQTLRPWTVDTANKLQHVGGLIYTLRNKSIVKMMNTQLNLLANSGVKLKHWLNYSARGGGSLQTRGLKGRSSSPKGEQRCFRPPTRGFRVFNALCLAFMAFK